MRTPDDECVDLLRRAARPLRGDATDHDLLLDLVGNKSLVLLGEASHGTHEFYLQRARITQRLIAEKGFHAVAIEGDWPDAARVNRHVRGTGRPADRTSATTRPMEPAAALAGFQRFPTWMWRNTVVAGFIDWLREFNSVRPMAVRTGFYGLDLYSLHGSITAVLDHLDQVDPGTAAALREQYACFGAFGPDSQVYGLMTGLRSARSCEAAVSAALAQLLQRSRQAAEHSNAVDDDESHFDDEQNARLVKNAERYYRSMYLGDVSTWNLRDQHMAEMLAELRTHLARRVSRPKIVVWAHNSHTGDARATEMGRLRGEQTLGQLVRERDPEDCLLIGMSTHSGTVTAASDWGAPAQQKRVRPSLGGSVEQLLHDTGLPRFWLPLRTGSEASEVLREPRLQRAIGVIYRPETERQSHYFFTRTAEQFDALLHLDSTSALSPLSPESAWRAGGGSQPMSQEALLDMPGDLPEAYPSGL
ncbi:MAG TPA: erythromycin esterase family protein [Ideonella sp.]|uniref:erythromycin esterase family protein n=1 Tax=Ideonella sp. TaxID=1929293 RepID=UPI002BE6E46E|nr:erythromycin esterase family protein [Ideonella sp.]HSI51802.1 erythromycin esterase family protein [Ideonella sp.]